MVRLSFHYTYDAKGHRIAASHYTVIYLIACKVYYLLSVKFVEHDGSHLYTSSRGSIRWSWWVHETCVRTDSHQSAWELDLIWKEKPDLLTVQLGLLSRVKGNEQPQLIQYLPTQVPPSLSWIVLYQVDFSLPRIRNVVTCENIWRYHGSRI